MPELDEACPDRAHTFSTFHVLHMEARGKNPIIC